MNELATKNDLSPAELRTREQLVATVKDGLKTFMLVGAALTRLRDERLYRNTHATFEKFCQSEFGMTRGNAYRLIRSVDVVQSLDAEALGVSEPKKEYHARLLSVIEDPAKRSVAWSEAVSLAGTSKVGSRHVKQAITKITEATNQAAIEMASIFNASARLEARFVEFARPCKEADDVKTRFGKLLERLEFYCRTVEPMGSEASK